MKVELSALGVLQHLACFVPFHHTPRAKIPLKALVTHCDGSRCLALFRLGSLRTELNMGSGASEHLPAERNLRIRRQQHDGAVHVR